MPQIYYSLGSIGYSKNQVDNLTPRIINELMGEYSYQESLKLKQGIVEVNFGRQGKLPKGLDAAITAYENSKNVDVSKKTDYNNIKEKSVEILAFINKQHNK